ncbi:hydroxymethyldihydropterin pyrophosphokinase-dihydropteroate synthase, putative [Plasmodium berghei]|uniref:2-amino-4-hydroxy-6-hydroxymethyldihydropteridine diphosphokinase n=2 Tax=Plasmodium berghei TaxID=5821 RepID=A0A509ASR9_PLABA|nr:hydroxymethyldihydropterin pyrophosphokinase-dihydropteroate synthase, putative [Plasmodium berghei ANKA]CXJ18085.1 hydroxymethyldihydropterin pyrophosphokinase-dihydropteroate synthase, putative [Plasmodium berghei]SCM26412.1 hydroxymethyldihydropterin pyrophosphokinase-dihydropteroate synthase, putative [Plasmodium berghei]SCN28443.1 hydroxymethyldihydropterin pyrophosphokinase-dihydropteroate synthase, putative [Plasmodium berghei]SCO62635.1 hydroxymethyldihydropterin pyrophosphokinase-di|eukprot:XP_034424090.1 hydroxymethyldihydropterin pyrophosphokinase-dihydropteroate synthase, putative [Plasmodium berghei ANKA]
MDIIEESNKCKENNKGNIVVLNFGTTDKTNAVTILETALYLTEKYIGKIINTSYMYETVPEYVVLDKSDIPKNIIGEDDPYDVSSLNDLVKGLEKSKYENVFQGEENLVSQCEEYERFLNNKDLFENKIKQISTEKYESETSNIIKENDEIMKINLEKHKNKYYTSYFYNLVVVFKCFIDDPLNLLVILKYIEHLMKRKNSKEVEKFENRLIDIDILFFNNYTIFEKNINLTKNDLYTIMCKYINIEYDNSSSDNCNKLSRNIEEIKDNIKFLSIPHVYTKHRYSILLCLNDIMPNYKHNALKETINKLHEEFITSFSKLYNTCIKKYNKRLYVLKNEVLCLKEKTNIVGILNTNYNSFSDGGLFVKPNIAVHRMFQMIKEGVDIIDIGGESSAPFVSHNPEIKERDLVIPVLELFEQEWNKMLQIRENGMEKQKDKLNQNDLSLQKKTSTIYKPPISIDTMNYDLFKECVDKNLVDILNDISACTNDPKIIKLLKKKNKYYSVVLMHKRGNPHTMDMLTQYEDVVYDIKKYLEDRLNFLTLNGIPRYRIILDIGLGFAKKHDQSIKLLQNIQVYDDCPLFIGYSRKRFISHTLAQTCAEICPNTISENENVQNDESGKNTFAVRNIRKDKDQYLYQKNILGGLAIASYCFDKKVEMIRVHDVFETRCVLDMMKRLHQTE